MSIKTGLYRHFKGKYYKVIDLVKHSETEEPLVIYQALYGDKKSWARPYSMFAEEIIRDGKTVKRFAYCDDQSEVLEIALLNVIPGMEKQFETNFTNAEKIISSMDGYISHRLKKCVEQESRYLLLVEWQTLEHHTVGFRESDEYQKWKELLHHFYQPFPKVEHFRHTG